MSESAKEKLARLRERRKRLEEPRDTPEATDGAVDELAERRAELLARRAALESSPKESYEQEGARADAGANDLAARRAALEERKRQLAAGSAAAPPAAAAPASVPVGTTADDLAARRAALEERKRKVAAAAGAAGAGAGSRGSVQPSADPTQEEIAARRAALAEKKRRLEEQQRAAAAQRAAGAGAGAGAGGTEDLAARKAALEERKRRLAMETSKPLEPEADPVAERRVELERRKRELEAAEAASVDPLAARRAELEQRKRALEGRDEPMDDIALRKAELEKRKRALEAGAVEEPMDDLARRKAELERRKRALEAGALEEPMDDLARRKADLERRKRELELDAAPPYAADRKTSPAGRGRGGPRRRFSELDEPSSEEEEDPLDLQEEREALIKRKRAGGRHGDKAAEKEKKIRILVLRKKLREEKDHLSPKEVAKIEAELEELGEIGRSEDKVARLEKQLKELEDKATTTEKDEELELYLDQIEELKGKIEREKKDAKVSELLKKKKELDVAAESVVSTAVVKEVAKLKEHVDHLKRRVMEEDLAHLEDMVKDVDEQTEKIMRTVDLAFLVDVTGSMGHAIQAAKDKVVAISQHFTSFNLTLRIAFVGYRDYDDSRRFEIYPFSLNPPEQLKEWLGRVTATGGGDAPEDVVGGLKEVLQLDWTSHTRLVIHIADAPCHGREYHNGLGDNHPDGAKCGTRPEDLLRQLMAKRVDYYFGEMNTHTNKMVDAFRRTYADDDKRLFQPLPLTAECSNFQAIVHKSISASCRNRGVELPPHLQRG